MDGREHQAPEVPLIEPLTRREREILALLAQGHTAPEMAAQLTLALSTVKWHLDRLYGKLGVNSKRQALNRARALALLTATSQPADQTPTARPPHNLPQQLTHFFGREDELVQLRERLAEYRLVTLTGPGGVGKTRLSLSFAADVLSDFRHGVWVVELAALTDPALLPQETAARLGVRDEPGRPVLETLTSFLRDRHLLLVLDNCEHLLEASARLCDALLRTSPFLKILATSRAALGVRGEAVLPVPSLPLPAAGQPLSHPHLGALAAVRLFADRAGLVRPNYALSERNAPAIAAICQRLDGLPLAIEMAAARMQALSTEQLAGRLDQAFRTLTSGDPTSLPRQQTLRATLDWSYDLLNAEERLLLQRLSVFAGGSALEAAEAVCPGDGLEAAQVMDVLASLVAKSMVVAHHQPGQAPRYRLLETVRQYALEKLEAAGEHDAVRRRHRDYFTEFAKAHEPTWGGQDRPSQLRKLHSEQENLRRALEWSFTDAADIEAGPRLIGLLFDCWPAHQEWVAWSLRAIAWCEYHPDISRTTYVQALQSGAPYVSLNDPQSAIALAERAVEITRTLGPGGAKTLMWGLRFLAWLYLDNLRNLAGARAAYAEAEVLFHSLGPEQLSADDYALYQAWFVGSRALLAVEQGDYAAAKQLATESCQLFETSTSRHTFAHGDSIRYLGEACLHLGEFDEAREHFQKVVLIAEGLGDMHGPNRKAFALRWLALTELRAGRLDQALAYCRASLQLANEVPDYNIIASGLGLIAAILAQRGQPAATARLSGASQAMYARQRRQPWEDSTLDTLLPGWREGPDAATLSAAYAAGLALSSGEAVELGLDEAAA